MSARGQPLHRCSIHRTRMSTRHSCTGRSVLHHCMQSGRGSSGGLAFHFIQIRDMQQYVEGLACVAAAAGCAGCWGRCTAQCPACDPATNCAPPSEVEVCLHASRGSINTPPLEAALQPVET